MEEPSKLPDDQIPTIPPPPPAFNQRPTTPLTPLTPPPAQTDQPKAKSLPADEPAPGYLTPNYGEQTKGQVNNQANVPDEFLHLFEHDPSEVIIYQALRHPFGVVFIYLVMALGMAAIILSYIFLISDNSLTSLGVSTSSNSVTTIGGIVTIALLVIAGLIGYAAAYVYRKSRLILTNQKVVIIHYHSLIGREVSQLNIANVEDVNVSQHSIIDRIFKSGRIVIETAGEQNRYILPQVEKPYEFARLTIQAHEGAVAEYGN